jgi:glycosyltransferase involved in cell wall biosynthesis
MPELIRSAPALFEARAGLHSASLATDSVKPKEQGTGGEIGYVVMGFPRISETFISNEIHLLETLGARLRVFAIKHGDKDQVHNSVGLIRAPITYLPPMTSLSGTNLIAWLRQNWPSYKSPHRRLFKRKPTAYLKTLASALAMSWRYRKSAFTLRKVFIKEFLQAGHIAAQVLDAGTVRHLHGHFCHGATTITWFVSRMTGLGFSFTAHAKDIYQADQNPGDLLKRKLDAARFATTCTGANEEHLAERFPDSKLVRTVYHGLDTRYFAPRVQADDCAGLECTHAAHARKGVAPALTLNAQARQVDGAVIAPDQEGLGTTGREPDLLANNKPEAVVLANNEPEPVVLGVGRFVEKKGFRYLIDACAILKRRGLRFRCVLLGEKGDQLEAIRTQIASLGLNAQVELRGPVTHDQLRDTYAQASVFVLPCLVAADGDRDGIPNVLAEAMAMGLPVVTTAISGIPELVDADKDGLVVPERNSQALAAALERILTDAVLRASLGAAARAKVCRMFDSRETTRELKALFDLAMRETVAS